MSGEIQAIFTLISLLCFCAIGFVIGRAFEREGWSRSLGHDSPLEAWRHVNRRRAEEHTHYEAAIARRDEWLDRLLAAPEESEVPAGWAILCSVIRAERRGKP